MTDGAKHLHDPRFFAGYSQLRRQTLGLDGAPEWSLVRAMLPDLTARRIVDLGHEHRYHRHVFLTPPWREIYHRDAERRHDLASANAEYERLLDAYPSLGCEIVTLPKVGVAERADFILNTLRIVPE
jgi:predicted ATPase